MLELLGRVVLGVDGGVLIVELRELLRRDVRGGSGVKRVLELRVGDVRRVVKLDGVR